MLRSYNHKGHHLDIPGTCFGQFGLVVQAGGDLLIDESPNPSHVYVRTIVKIVGQSKVRNSHCR